MRRDVRAAGVRRLVVGMADVEAAATSYERLGLRILERTGGRAVVELPCGIRMVLTASSPGPAAASGRQARVPAPRVA